jgi:hypothetical protein
MTCRGHGFPDGRIDTIYNRRIMFLFFCLNYLLVVCFHFLKKKRILAGKTDKGLTRTRKITQFSTTKLRHYIVHGSGTNVVIFKNFRQKIWRK